MTDTKQDETKLRTAFDPLDSAKVHFAIVGNAQKLTSFNYLKIEIQTGRDLASRNPRRNRRCRAPRSRADMQARFLRLAERIASAGLESLTEPHVKHLEGKPWEICG